MKTQRSRLEAYYSLPGARHPDDEKAVLAAADAYDVAVAAGKIAPGQLQVIIDAVSNPRTRVWENCIYLLQSASEQWPQAAEAILDMMRSTKANVRFAALCSLGPQTPSPVIDQAIRNGLCDRSSRVRWKAADKANQLDCKHLIPDVQRALQSETNARAKASIELDCAFLRDGYLAKPQGDGSFHISIKLPRGGTCVNVSAKELEERGIEAILSEARRR
jgi:hypothetical protein